MASPRKRLAEDNAAAEKPDVVSLAAPVGGAAPGTPAWHASEAVDSTPMAVDPLVAAKQAQAQRFAEERRAWRLHEGQRPRARQAAGWEAGVRHSPDQAAEQAATVRRSPDQAHTYAVDEHAYLDALAQETLRHSPGQALAGQHGWPTQQALGERPGSAPLSPRAARRRRQEEEGRRFRQAAEDKYRQHVLVRQRM